MDVHAMKEMYKQKWKDALREIEYLKSQLKHYTDQSWELDAARQRAEELTSYEWK